MKEMLEVQLVLSLESLRTVARTPAEGGRARVDLPLADQPHSRPSPAPSSPGRPPGRERTHLLKGDGGRISCESK